MKILSVDDQGRNRGGSGALWTGSRIRPLRRVNIRHNVGRICGALKVLARPFGAEGQNGIAALLDDIRTSDQRRISCSRHIFVLVKIVILMKHNTLNVFRQACS
jgi:hypothetical protein